MGEAQFDNVSRMAKALAASGQFKDITQWEQAFGRILLGSDMGMTPTQALMNLDVVRGNIQVRGKWLLAKIKGSENYDCDVIERTPERGALQFFEKSKRTGEWRKVGPLKDPEKPEGPDNPAGPIVFTLEQAKAKGLWAKGGGWDNWPENMCLWRCTSIGFNLFCPDLSGGVSVYTEADSFIDGSAVEIGQGEGDGSAPPWEGVDEERAAKVDGLVAWAESKGLPLFGDLAVVRMRLMGQTVEAIDEWIAAAEEQRAQIEGAE
jgi:hypothetical protein